MSKTERKKKNNINSIYYDINKEKNDSEAFDTKKINIIPAFNEKNVAIAISSSNYYAPYLSVLLQSIKANSSEENNYDIIVLTTDISETNQQILLKGIADENFSLRFIDVSEFIKDKNLYIGDLSIETYFRLLLIDIMKYYEKVVFLDCDTIVNNDVAALFNLNLCDKYLIAARDANLITTVQWSDKWINYFNDILKIKNKNDYFQAGVLVLNIKKLRADFTLNALMNMCCSYEWKLYDQDVLNVICQDNFTLLDMRWNVMSGEEYRLQNILNNAPNELREEYLTARSDPFLIHYCGKKKPWDYVESDYSNIFWSYAKSSPFYEIILSRMIENSSVKQLRTDISLNRQSIEEIKKVFGLFPVKRNLENNSTVNKTKAFTGEEIIITGVEKNSVGNCYYKFGKKEPGQGVFYEIRDYTPNNILSYTLDKKGSYSFSVQIKDEYGGECTKILHVTAIERVLPKVELAPIRQHPDKPVALFRCLSVFQLLNAVNLKTTILKDVTADLILSKATDFHAFFEGLREQKIFRNIYISDDTPETYFEWKRASKEEQLQMILYPEFYVQLVDLEETYTDYYIAVADEYSKLFYYHMVKKGLRPRIHIFEDGLSTYLIDQKQECDQDIWMHDVYKELAFINNVDEILLYMPELHTEGGLNCAVNAIPKISYQDDSVRKMYNKIFNYNVLPKEKYIFLEEAFVWDGIASTDMDLVETISKFVGKENIVVKMHPRNNIDRFTKEGYKTVENSKIPWELTVMNSDLSDKVFITVSSTSAFTGGLVFDKPFKTINLFDLMLLGKNVHVRNPKFREFYNRLLEIFNKESIQIFHPTTMNELKEEILYLEGEVKDNE